LSKYFDSAASYPEIHSYYKDRRLEKDGNPSSIHSFGANASQVLARASQSIKSSLLAVRIETNMYFTGSATESINTFIKGYCLGKSGTILIGNNEHKAVKEAAYWLEKYCDIKVVETSYERFEDAVCEITAPPEDDDTYRLGRRIGAGENLLLVSFMLVNNETGRIYDIRRLREILDRNNLPGVVLHTDATAAVGHLDFVFDYLGADALSFGGHKFGAPIGIGGLITKKGIELQPIISGGGQQRGVVSGTVNWKAAYIMAMVLEEQFFSRTERNKRFAELKDLFKGMQVVGGGKMVSNIINVIVDKDPEKLMFQLDEKGFAVSIGSACSAGVIQPSYVLLNEGYTKEQALRGVRVSFHEGNTTEETEELVKLLL
jgi:cysteine desulfurase